MLKYWMSHEYNEYIKYISKIWIYFWQFWKLLFDYKWKIAMDLFSKFDNLLHWDRNKSQAH